MLKNADHASSLSQIEYLSREEVTLKGYKNGLQIKNQKTALTLDD